MRTVVVTGGARGIGEAIIRIFVEQGDRAISLDLSEPDAPIAGAIYRHADVTDPESVRFALSGVGEIDVLVNNAGIQRVGLIGNLSFEEWSSVIATHLTGAFVCNSLVVPMMRRRESGVVVHIASAAAFVGLPGRGPYSAAKAGLLALTRVMAVELASDGVRVNAVAPGFTRTKLIQQGLDDGSLSETWMVERVPMARLAKPDEVARAVRFLAGDEASFITGQCLLIDGGWTVQGIGQAPDWLSSSTLEAN